MAKNSWAAEAIEKLLKGEKAQVRPFGRSMEPLVMSGQLVTLEPIVKYENIFNFTIRDIVLVSVNSTVYLHKIISVIMDLDDDNTIKVLIGNNKGKINGWVGIENLYGKVVKIGD